VKSPGGGGTIVTAQIPLQRMLSSEAA
jgi:hypothetical protein